MQYFTKAIVDGGTIKLQTYGQVLSNAYVHSFLLKKHGSIIVPVCSMYLQPNQGLLNQTQFFYFFYRNSIFLLHVSLKLRATPTEEFLLTCNSKRNCLTSLFLWERNFCGLVLIFGGATVSNRCSSSLVGPLARNMNKKLQLPYFLIICFEWCKKMLLVNKISNVKKISYISYQNLQG